MRARPTEVAGRAPGWLRWVLTVLGLAVLSGVLVAGYAVDQYRLGVFDEWVYADALDQASRGEVVEQGERVGLYARELSSCRGVEAGSAGPACGEPYVSEQYPQRGITSADIHPPTYFFLTAALSRPLLATGAVEDLLLAGRLVGAVWLTAGLVALVLLCRELGAGRRATAAVVVAVALSPIVRTTNSYVTPDALNLLMGASVVLAALKVARRHWHWAVLPALAALAVAVKFQNIVAVGVAAALLATLRLVQQPRDAVLMSRARALAVPALTVAAALVTAVGWLAVRASLSQGDSPAQSARELPLSLRLALRETTSFTTGIVGSGGGFPLDVRGTYLSWLLLAGLGAALAMSHRGSALRHAAGWLAAGLLLASPALLVAQQVVNGFAVRSPDRYGMSLLPLFAALAAVALRRGRLATAVLVLWSLFALDALVRAVG